MKLYFVVNARIPTKKAYGIHVAKMSEAFLDNGNELVLVIPRTQASHSSIREFYGLARDIPVVTLFTLDWYDRGSAGFIVSSVLFMLSSLFYFWTKNLAGKRGTIYTTDMDRFSFAFLPFAGMPVFSEMHDWRGDTMPTKFFFKKAHGIIATNKETAERINTTFKLSPSKVLIEANGADISLIQSAPSQDEARSKLNLIMEQKIALYVGRFYDWKGLEILIEAARNAPLISWYVVGGSQEEFIAATKARAESGLLPSNLHFPGECTFEDVPVWFAAADVCLVIGTKSNSQSYSHTSPMKVYEYMAARRAVVASATPALESIIPFDEVFWCEPDNASNLAEAVQRAMRESVERDAMVVRAHTDAEQHSWKKRAERISAFIQQR